MKKISTLFSSVFSTVLLLTPFLSAYAAEKPQNFKELVENTIIGGILRPVVPLLVGVAVVVFVYGVIIFMFSEGGEKKEEGKQFMFWGIIGIFVMVSVWGLVAVLQGTFNLPEGNQSIEIKLPGS